MTTTKTATKKTRAPKKVVPIPELPINPFVFEILDAASSQRAKAKKVEVLKKYEHDSVKMICIWNFDESVISLLPEGPVPYGETNAQTTFAGTLSDNLIKEAGGGESATGQDLDGRGRTSLRREWKNLYHYIKGGNDKLATTRREMMFINLLRGLHAREAEILCLVKDKDLESQYKITWGVVKQAFPKMTWSNS